MTATGHPPPLPGFFALTFALSLPFWGLGAVTGRLAERLPVQLPASALMFVCPGVAALLSVPEARPLLARVFDLRRVRRPVWLLPTVLLMPAVLGLSYAIMRATHRPLPEPHLPWSALPLLLVLFFVAAACEELGWTGYATGPLQARRGALGAGVLLGAVWAGWHVVPYLQAGRSWGWIVWQGLATVALRVLLVWLYNHTGRSVLVAALFHTLVNVSTFMFPNGGSHDDPAVTGTLLVLAAASVVWLWGPGTLADWRFRTFRAR